MKCNNCNSEWQVSVDMVRMIENCPFCNQPLTSELPNDIREVLKDCVSRRGYSVLETNYAYAYLLDLVVGFEKEKRYLKMAFDNGVAKEFVVIYKTGGFKTTAQTLLFKNKTQNLGFSDELVDYVIDTLLYSVGLSFENTSLQSNSEIDMNISNNVRNNIEKKIEKKNYDTNFEKEKPASNHLKQKWTGESVGIRPYQSRKTSKARPKQTRIVSSVGIRSDESRKSYLKEIKFRNGSRYDLRIHGEITETAYLKDLEIDILKSSDRIQVVLEYTDCREGFSSRRIKENIGIENGESSEFDLSQTYVDIISGQNPSDNNSKIIIDEELISEDKSQTRISLGSILNEVIEFELHLCLVTQGVKSFEGSLDDIVRQKPIVNKYHYDSRNLEWEKSHGIPKTHFTTNLKLINIDRNYNQSIVAATLSFLVVKDEYVLTGIASQTIILNNCIITNIDKITNSEKKKICLELYDIVDRLTFEITNEATKGEGINIDY